MIKNITGPAVVSLLLSNIPRVLRFLRSTCSGIGVASGPADITPILDGEDRDVRPIQEQLGRCRNCERVLTRVGDTWLEFPYQWEPMPDSRASFEAFRKRCEEAMAFTAARKRRDDARKDAEQ